MAREEQAREDLLAEARNLVERVSLRFPQQSTDEETIAGFRRDGSLAVYFGQERVYQFTSTGSLRRAYVEGLLYKAASGRLVSMRRERTAEVVNLVSRQLDAHETSSFLEEMRDHLLALRHAIDTRDYTPGGQVPPSAKIVERLLDWLSRYADGTKIAINPQSA